MRKLLFLLFPSFAAVLVLGCSNDENEMPCVKCSEPYNPYVYCLYHYYGYMDSYECVYMPDNNCNGQTYGSDNTCGGYLRSSSSSRPVSSSSSRPSSSSNAVEYTGGSCNVNDYGTVNINGQIWMAKNWGCYAPGSKCYNNDPAYCNEYGRLYDWATAMDIDTRYNNKYWNGSDVNHKGICPSGWHIPSNADWDRLYRYADGTSGTGLYDSPTAGRYLKARDGWNSGGNGEDTFGFAALPGGYGGSGGYFDGVGDFGGWWSASEYSANIAYGRYMNYNYEGVGRGNYGKGFSLLSVRCLQD